MESVQNDHIVAVGNILYFRADDGTNGKELWKSDGTASGTVMVKDIHSGNDYPMLFKAVGNTLYFRANDGTHGYELWKSDGTASGTVMVHDINPNSDGYPYSNYLIAVGNTLFFRANDGSSAELWTSDGTASGTVSVAGSSDVPSLITSINTTVYFVNSPGTISVSYTHLTLPTIYSV